MIIIMWYGTARPLRSLAVTFDLGNKLLDCVKLVSSNPEELPCRSGDSNMSFTLELSLAFVHKLSAQRILPLRKLISLFKARSCTYIRQPATDCLW